jgi:hypothetical protein
MHSFFHQGEVVHGIELGMEPYWGYFGTFATALIAFLARSYAHGAIIQAYESADGKRLGFQLHNMMGYPGRKIEVNIGQAKLLSPKETYLKSDGVAVAPSSLGSKFFPNSNQIPVRVDGWRLNILLDKQGKYYEDHRIFDLLSTPTFEVKSEEINIAKEERIAFNKEVRHNHKNNRKNNIEK